MLSYTECLLLRCFQDVAQDYPDIQTNDMFINAACYNVVRNPERFGIIVTSNQYRDVFSDLVAAVAGSLGLASGVNVGDNVAMFEASHGSTPKLQARVMRILWLWY